MRLVTIFFFWFCLYSVDGSLVASSPSKTIYMIHWMKSGRTILGETFFNYFKDKKLNVQIVERFCEQDVEKLRAFIKEAKTSRPDLIYVYSTIGAIETVGQMGAVDPNKHITDIPVVIVAHSEPVASKLVTEIGKPTGRNVTGVGHHVPAETAFLIMKNFTAHVKNIATLSNYREDNSRNGVKNMKALEEKFDFKLNDFYLPLTGDYKINFQELDKMVLKILEQKPDVVFFPSDGLTQNHTSEIVKIFEKYKHIHRAPIFTTLEDMVLPDLSCTFAFFTSFYVMGLMAASKAEDILFKGMDVKEIPYDIGTQMTLLIREDTMKTFETYPTLGFLEVSQFFTKKDAQSPKTEVKS